jgi:hypothetical protein
MLLVQRVRVPPNPWVLQVASNVKTSTKDLSLREGDENCEAEQQILSQKKSTGAH